jgi:hypothetical protein
MFCPNCGEELPPCPLSEISFCPHCGFDFRPIFQSGAKARPIEKSKSKNHATLKLVFLIWFVVAVLFGSGLGLFLTFNNREAAALDSDAIAEDGAVQDSAVKDLPEKNTPGSNAPNMTEEETTLAVAYEEAVRYAIKDVQENSDGTSRASVTMTTPNMSVILDEALKEMTKAENEGKSVDELNVIAEAFILQGLQDNEETTARTFEAQVQLEDGEWQVVRDASWEEAYFGDLQAVFKEYLASYMSD